MKDTRRSLQYGQALVEFTLILLAFMLIVLVIFDLGRVAYYYGQVHNAAREGARYAVAHPSHTLANIEEAAEKYTVGMDLTVWAPAYTERTITITVEVDYHPVSPILIWIFDPDGPGDPGYDPLKLRSQATMQKEY